MIRACAGHETAVWVLLSVLLEPLQQVGRNRDVAFLFVFDLELVFRLGSDLQRSAYKVDVVPCQVNRLLIAQSGLQQQLEDQINVVIFDRVKKGLQLLTGIDFRHRLFELRAAWREFLDVEFAESQKRNHACMTIVYGALGAASLTKCALVAQNILRRNLVGIDLADCFQELVGCRAVDGGSYIRAAILRSLNEVVEFARQTQPSRHFLDLDAGLFGRSLCFQQVLSLRSGSQSSGGIFTGVLVHHASAFVGPKLVAPFFEFALLTINDHEVRLDPAILSYRGWVAPPALRCFAKAHQDDFLVGHTLSSPSQ